MEDTYIVVCAGCFAGMEREGSVKDAPKELRKLGWTKTKTKKWLCKECSR